MLISLTSKRQPSKKVPYFHSAVSSVILSSTTVHLSFKNPRCASPTFPQPHHSCHCWQIKSYYQKVFVTVISPQTLKPWLLICWVKLVHLESKWRHIWDLSPQNPPLTRFCPHPTITLVYPHKDTVDPRTNICMTKMREELRFKQFCHY